MGKNRLFKLLGVIVLISLMICSCSKIPSDEEAIGAINMFEYTKPSLIMVEANENIDKNMAKVVAEIEYKDEYIGYKQEKEYQFCKNDKKWGVMSSNNLTHPTYYPLVGSGLTEDAINSYVLWTEGIFFEGVDEAYRLDGIKIQKDTEEINIESAPYLESISYDLLFDNNLFVGSSKAIVKTTFSESNGNWDIDKIEQISPIKLEWKEGYSFKFNNTDFITYLDSWNNDLEFEDPNKNITVTLKSDDDLKIEVVQEPTPLTPYECDAIISLNAFNGVYNVSAELQCVYKNSGGKAWYIDSVNVLSINDVSMQELIGKWEGYYYLASSYGAVASKRNMRLVVDELVESNATYIGTAFLYSDESFEDAKLVTQYSFTISYNNYNGCLELSSGSVLASAGDELDFIYTFGEDNKLLGVIDVFVNGKVDENLNETMLEKVD